MCKGCGVMIIRKSKVIVVLAKGLAQCQINIERAKEDKSKYGTEWFDNYILRQ